MKSLYPTGIPAIPESGLPTLDSGDRALAYSTGGSQGDGLVLWDGNQWLQRRNSSVPDIVYSGATNDIWYAAGAINATAAANLTVVANTLYAVAFKTSRQLTIDRLGFGITTAVAGQNAIIGIYSDNNNPLSPQPGALLVAGANSSTAAALAIKTTVNQVLQAGVVYWAVFYASGTPGVRSIPVGGSAVTGWPTTLVGSPSNHLRATRTYDGTLPAVFPSTIGHFGGNIPAVFFRIA